MQIESVMKLFRLKFILLGLLWYLCHAWCLSKCGAEFDDPASSAFLADIVLIGRLSQKLPAKDNNNYNVTVSIRNKKSILKGETLVFRLLNWKLLTVGEFSDGVDPERCLSGLDKGTEYIFFLKDTGGGYLKNSAIPLSAKNRTDFKKWKKAIQKIVCGKSSCVDQIQFNNGTSMKDIELQKGQNLELKCILMRKPFPEVVFTWFKDGSPVRNKGVLIKNIKNSSRLVIEKSTSSDSGKYECIARNVATESIKSAVVTIYETVDIKQKFKGNLTLNCRSTNKTAASVFTWKKNNRVIVNGSKEGLTIKSKSYESQLSQKHFLLSDEGVYTCIVKTDGHESQTRYTVTVFDVPGTTAPKKKVPCSIEYKNYCLNNGTCEHWVELDKISCVCPKGFTDERCQEFSIEEMRKTVESFETQNRNLIIVGIISGTLIFIGICVTVHLLIKYRSHRYSRGRQIEKNAKNNEYISGQIRRDDQLKQPLTTVSMDKEVQTTEACFRLSDKANLLSDKANLDKNSPESSKRLRKGAVSLEEKLKDVKCEQRNSKNINKYNLNLKSVSEQNGFPVDKFAVGCEVKDTNNLSPKNNQGLHESDKLLGAVTAVKNIPSPSQPLTLMLEESDEETNCDNGVHLTILYISEDESKSEVKICSPRQSAVNDTVNKENLANSKSRETNLNLPLSASDNNVMKAKDFIGSPTSKSYSSSNSNDSSSTTTEGRNSPNIAWLNAQKALNGSPAPFNEKSFHDPSQQSHSSNFAPIKTGRPDNKQCSQIRKTNDNVAMKPAIDAKTQRENLSVWPNGSNNDSSGLKEQSEMRPPKTNNDCIRQSKDVSNAKSYSKDSNCTKQTGGVIGIPSKRENSEIRHPRGGSDEKHCRGTNQIKSHRKISDERNNGLKRMDRDTYTIAT